MSSFVYDDLSPPAGKTNAKNLTGLASQSVTAEEWNAVMQFLEDIRAAIVSGDYSALRDYAAGLSAAGTGRLRYSGNTIQASLNGDAYRGIVPAKGLVTNEELGILPSNTAQQNSDAWDAAMAAIPVGEVRQWDFGPGLYFFERTAEIRRELKLVGRGGYNQAGTYFRWNSGNMCGLWVRGSDIGEGGGGNGSRIDNIRISSGGNQAYTDGRTATADGSNVIVLSGSNGQLTTGRWVIIGDPLTQEANQITGYSGLQITLKNPVPAGAGLAISFARHYGLYFNAVIQVQNVQVDGGFYAGVYGYGNVGASTNVSSSVFIGVASNANVQGFQIGGPDGNNVNFIGCNASVNTEWGFQDFSFLGNSYSGCRAENNTNAYQTTESTAESSYVGCYAEAGQEIDIAGSCYWWGGTVGDGISAFTGAGIAFTTGGYVMGGAPRFIMFNALGSSGFQQIGGDRAPNQIAKFRSPNSDGGEEWADKWNENGAILSFCIGREVWSSNGDAARYTTGSNSKNINTGNTKASFPYSAFSRGFYLGGRRWNVLDAQGAGLSISAAVLGLLGASWSVNKGDLFWDLRPEAGQHVGWRCTSAGTTGSYTDGLTATSAGGTSLTLSGSNISLYIGLYITVDGVATQVVSVSGTSLVVANAIPAGAGKVISYTVPVYQSIGRLGGGAGDSTGTPGNATLNTAKGRSAIATGAGSVTITNSLVTATSIVTAVLQTVDGTLTQLLTVVCSSGSFTITGNANATGNVNVAWVLHE